MIKTGDYAYTLTYLLTYSMEQSPHWEANWFSTSSEIPFILWNPKVHYCIHNCLPPVPILSQSNPAPAPPSHCKTHINIILPSMSGSSKWSISLRFPHQNPEYAYMHINIKIGQTKDSKKYKRKDAYMKIRRQFSKVLKTSSREKICGARSWQPKATERQKTFHPMCCINWSWYGNMN